MLLVILCPVSFLRVLCHTLASCCKLFCRVLSTCASHSSMSPLKRTHTYRRANGHTHTHVTHPHTRPRPCPRAHAPPQLRELVADFYNCRYERCLRTLDGMLPALQLDMHLAEHVKDLHSQVWGRGCRGGGLGCGGGGVG